MGELAGISDSEFNMWRAVFAFTFADNVLSVEEQVLLNSYLKNVNFSHTQREVLKSDLKKPKNVVEMYRKITNPKDKKRFCVLARAIVWCEGDMGEQEEEILRRVSCLSEKEENIIFERTRNHPHIHDYYQEYAKTGMMGLFKEPPAVVRYA